IQYISKPCLGNISGNQHWISPDSNQATTDLLEISQLAKSQPVLLLCAEMDWHKCHRVEVAEKLGEMTNLAIGHLT
ncbi:MAG: DUF488 domain-containing protein, partial [Jaaginema sp. PMC 1078.18]|nr:DUF488 domain-containing protein [Jaaginema sp. PMC 1078.18]